MKRKLFLLVPFISLIASCSISNGTSSSNASSSSQGASSSTSVNPSAEGLDPADPETDPENILLYDTLYNHSSDVLITINIKDAQLAKVIEYGAKDNSTKHDIYSPCDVTVKINDEVREYQEVGVRVKGNMSREDDVPACMTNGKFNGHLNLKLSFNSTFEDTPGYNASTPVATLKARRFGKAKKINLKWNRSYDEDFVREAYANHILESEGMMAQKVNNIKVVVKTDSYTTGELLYSVQENVDAQFLNKRLSEASREGDLYKGGWSKDGRHNCSLDETNGSNLFGVEDCTQNKYFVYDLKTNKDNSNMSNIKNLINMLKSDDTGASQEELKNKYNQYMDGDYITKLMALEWILSSPDSLRFNYNNTCFYFSSSNGKMYPIMFDNDRVMGIINGWDQRPFTRYPTSTKVSGGGTQVSPLYWRTILTSDSNAYYTERYPVITEYREKYLNYIEEFSTKYLNMDAYNAFKAEFKYTDNCDGGNVSFQDFITEANKQIKECMESLGR